MIKNNWKNTALVIWMLCFCKSMHAQDLFLVSQQPDCRKRFLFVPNESEDSLFMLNPSFEHGFLLPELVNLPKRRLQESGYSNSVWNLVLPESNAPEHLSRAFKHLGEVTGCQIAGVLGRDVLDGRTLVYNSLLNQLTIKTGEVQIEGFDSYDIQIDGNSITWPSMYAGNVIDISLAFFSDCDLEVPTEEFEQLSELSGKTPKSRMTMTDGKVGESRFLELSESEIEIEHVTATNIVVTECELNCFRMGFGFLQRTDFQICFDKDHPCIRFRKSPFFRRNLLRLSPGELNGVMNEKGFLIGRVSKEGRFQGKLEPRDVLTKINDLVVSDFLTDIVIEKLLLADSSGGEITILRNGNEQTLSLSDY